VSARTREPETPETPGAANIVLVGFMGAGKTTVGRRLAEVLGWRFIDLDEEIVREAGMPVAEIFRTRGEAAFRDLESRLTARLSSVHRTVLAPGGGWIADPANAERLPPATSTVWLRVSPEEAVRRILATGAERPLLSGVEDPVVLARLLLARREPLYRTADLIVDVDGRTPDEVAGEIRTRIRFEG
jgi:shikimate kinase